MTSESVRLERCYPAGHRNRHVPHLCPECLGPLTADGRCTGCGTARLAEPPSLRFPDRRARLRRMERVAGH
jgi:hypothetical protein